MRRTKAQLLEDLETLQGVNFALSDKIFVLEKDLREWKQLARYANDVNQKLIDRCGCGFSESQNPGNGQVH